MVFVENAFKHSASSQVYGISINITIDVDKDNILYFKCVNNYHSQSNVESLSNGIGLENVKKRLDLIYPNLYHLDIILEDETYTVKLNIKLNKTTP